MSGVKRYLNDGFLLPDGRTYVLATDYDQLLATTAKLREALTELLDARGTSLNIVGHDPVSGHPLSREGMAALKARAALSSTTP